ncbi:MAG TPA: serine hydrolase domain-containing protein [Casimicrobiaceae bacterium]|nr:serine hydrolase domain-containing protein [Casimicrobiaceae bacterium]
MQVQNTLRNALAVLLVVSSASLAPPAAAAAAEPRQLDRPFPAAKRQAIDSAVNQAFAATKAPGVVVGVWVQGEGAYVAAKGFADIKSKQPMRSSYYFRIGSITKTFTVTVLLQLADEKKVSLDDPVNKYVDFVPNGENITLRELANMTSGLYNYTEDDAWVKLAFSDFGRRWKPRELVDVGISHPPYFAPGTGFHYSNTNTVLLGMIIEKVTNNWIHDVFADRIFKPLHLRHTVWPAGAAWPGPHASGITEQTLSGARADATNRNPSWAFTAGELISTMGDLRIWVQSYTNGTLVSPEMQKQRLTWVTFPPNTSVKRYGLGIGEDHGWLGHTGELPGYNTAAYYLPEMKATIVVMVNSDIAVQGANPAPTIAKALAKVVSPNNVPE